LVKFTGKENPISISYQHQKKELQLEGFEGKERGIRS
jgi:hypothetical protein